MKQYSILEDSRRSPAQDGRCGRSGRGLLAAILCMGGAAGTKALKF